MRRARECIPGVGFVSIALIVVATISPGARANVLANPSFETPDASAGDVFATVANSSWNGFNAAFITRSVARTGNQSFKAFGNPGGAFQDFAASPGQTWTGSVYADNFSADPLLGSQGAFINIEWHDSGNALISFLSTQIIDSASPRDVWTLGTVSGIAPAGTATARLVLLSGPFTGQPGTPGGAAFFDDAAFDVGTVPEPVSLGWLGLGAIITARRRR